MEQGYKINRFTFIKAADYRIDKISGKRRMSVFKCDCGNIKTYDHSAVKLGKVKMCFKCSILDRAEKRKTHGLIKHPLYSKWQDMKKRCYNKKVDRYKNYGALGIIVCNEWKNNFYSFYKWSIDNGWKDGLQIDRKDNYKNYTPDNCRYVTSIEQGFNKKNTIYIDYNGVKISLAKIMYTNGKSDKYKNAWYMLNKGGKTSLDVINKYNLRLVEKGEKDIKDVDFSIGIIQV